MKRFLLLLFVINICAAFAACGSDGEQSASSDDDVSFWEETSEEYSGTVFTTREEYGDGGCILREYTESGVLLCESTYSDDALVSERFYSSNGQAQKAVFYGDGGLVESISTYTVEGNKLTEVAKKEDGTLIESFVYTYQSGNVLSVLEQYDSDGARIFNVWYLYDEGNRLKEEQGFLYNGAAVYSTYTYTYDPASGDIIRSEQVDFDENGVFVSHEVYTVLDDEMVLTERYDENGNSLPLD